MLFVHDLGGGIEGGEGIFIANIKRPPAACSMNTHAQQVFLHGCHDAEGPPCFSMYKYLVSHLKGGGRTDDE